MGVTVEQRIEGLANKIERWEDLITNCKYKIESYKDKIKQSKATIKVLSKKQVKKAVKAALDESAEGADVISIRRGRPKKVASV